MGIQVHTQKHAPAVTDRAYSMCCCYQGLLPMLKEIQTPVHIREYAGMKLAIDGYVSFI